MRTRDFEEKRPDEQMEGDFADRGHIVILAQAKAALGQQNRRQRAGDQQQIVEMIVQKGAVNVRFDQPAIDRVKRATKQE
jgi:hypothetical protein